MSQQNNNINNNNINNNKKNKLYETTFDKIQKLGEGTYSVVYKVSKKNNDNETIYYALKKFKNILNNNGCNDSALKEITILKEIFHENILKIIDTFYSIKELFILYEYIDYDFITLNTKNYYKYLTESDTKNLMKQILTGFNILHKNGILHRDIKPDNFVMGLDELSNNVYLIDFGLAKKYRSMSTLIQYPISKKNKLTGTARYASINVLKGYEHSRRDDLESVGYILIYFLKGKLPWQNINAKTKEEKYKKILEKKMEVSSYELCKGFPKEFETYLEYIKKLGYEESPDYEMIRKLFDNEKKNYNYIFMIGQL